MKNFVIIATNHIIKHSINETFFRATELFLGQTIRSVFSEVTVKIRIAVLMDLAQIKYNEILQYIRVCFNAVNVFNLVTVYIVFGGPKLIAFSSLSAYILIIISVFIEKKNYVMIFEASVILPAKFIWIKSLYVLTICIIEIDRKNVTYKEQ